jgi:holo-[acyl-carrier protein] synthase
MIFGVGIDEIEVARLEERLGRTDGLKEKLFTPREIEYCGAKRHGAQNFAARFAAKEAFLKAMGTGWRNGAAFAEIEIINDDLGKPVCVVHGKVKEFIETNGITGIHVSLSHLDDIAAAIVMLEK